MSLEMKNNLEHYCFLFSQCYEKIKFSGNAVFAYNQFCSFTTVSVFCLIGINHKVPSLEVDINILFFTGIEIPQRSVDVTVRSSSVSQAMKCILKHLTKGDLTLIGD